MYGDPHDEYVTGLKDEITGLSAVDREYVTGVAPSPAPVEWDEDAGQYVVKDSGKMARHSDGVVRDTQEGKVKFSLMFPRGQRMKDTLIYRVAKLYTSGGEKYGDRNWENSCAPDTLDHHVNALWRHFMNFFFEEGAEEDHAAAIVWNIQAVELTRRNTKKNTPLDPEDQGATIEKAVVRLTTAPPYTFPLPVAPAIPSNVKNGTATDEPE